MNKDSNVLVEKYRPNNFDDIVLDPINKQIFLNIINTGYFPNLLFYGPPGTGKTTTIINLIDSYQNKYDQKNKELIIHLNASDERGIDIIRNQINQFVNSKTMFNKGMKFVILDEVDYMTKNAQCALRYILQTFSNSVRFCLICNYISRIDEGLQNEFLRIRFNQLPEDDILHFLTNISVLENLNFSDKSLRLIQKLYKSDIRSMINFMQSNQNKSDDEINIIDNRVWIELCDLLIDDTNYKLTNNVRELDINKINIHVNNISIKYNVEKKNIIKDFLNYIIRNNEQNNTPEFFNFVENIIHFEDCTNSLYVNYSLVKLSKLLKELC
jgi:DNA polymerase III delta prime subunit